MFVDRVAEIVVPVHAVARGVYSVRSTEVRTRIENTAHKAVGSLVDGAGHLTQDIDEIALNFDLPLAVAIAEGNDRVQGHPPQCPAIADENASHRFGLGCGNHLAVPEHDADGRVAADLKDRLEHPLEATGLSGVRPPPRGISVDWPICLLKGTASLPTDRACPGRRTADDHRFLSDFTQATDGLVTP